MVLRMVSLLAAFSLLCSPALGWNHGLKTQGHLTAQERAEALKVIKIKFQELYVFPEMRQPIVDRLTQSQQAGHYDVEDPVLFAERITRDLRDVAHDEHLRLSVDPAAYAAALAPPKSDAGEEAFRRRRALRNHHGLTEMRLLPGNIRYLKITHFEWVPNETSAVYDEAMRFLQGGDAIIIDLRGNGGGTSSAANYLISHFRDPGTSDYLSANASKTPEPSSVTDYLPAGRIKGKPLYMLIDGGVGSAAEAVAYDIQQFKIGELIGARTVGAANNNKLLPIAPNFILSVSYDRPLHVISKTNWEGVGVKPAVECAPFQALEVAQLRALKQLAQVPGITPETQAEYAWARSPLEAHLHPVTLKPSQLQALVGRYVRANSSVGEIDVSIKNGALWLNLPNRPDSPLLPLTSDRVFAIEGSDFLRVRLANNRLELLWWDDPHPRVFLRQ